MPAYCFFYRHLTDEKNNENIIYKHYIALFGIMLYFAVLLLLLIPANVGYAQTKSLCPTKVLDKGTVEGIYAGIDEEGNLSAIIVLDSGEKMYFRWDGDVNKVEEYFGAIGNKVSVDYEVKQFWDEMEDSEYCARTEVIKSGKILVVGADKDIAKKLNANENENTNTEQAATVPQQCPIKWETSHSYRKSDGKIVDRWLELTSVVDSVEIKKVTINRGNCKVSDPRTCVQNAPYSEEDISRARESGEKKIATLNDDGTRAIWDDVEGYIYQPQKAKAALDAHIEQMRHATKCIKYDYGVLKFGETEKIGYNNQCENVLELVIDTDKGQWTWNLNK